jgi:murein DD-endopeptidase MepM/ murein hydrolase activator NlpD
MVAIPQMGVMIMDDGRQFGDAATSWLVASRPTSVRLALQGAPERPGMRTVGIVPPEKFTLRTAVKAASAEGLFYIAAPRSVDDPLSVLVDAARGAARVIDDQHLGFAILLADDEVKLDRIAVVADLADPVTTGVAAWAAVGLATMAHSELHVLVLGAAEDSNPRDWREAMEWFKVRDGGEELFVDALERADEHGLVMRWHGLGTPMDKPSAVLRAVVRGEYDFVVDDLPPINVGPRPGRRRRVQAALSQAGSNATAYRLLRDAPCSVAIVLDAARMGLAPPHVVRAGAAAVAMGVVGAGTVAAAGTAAAEPNAETAAAMPAAEASAAEAAVAEAQPAPALDYSAMTEADLAAMSQQRDETAQLRDRNAAQLKIEHQELQAKTTELASVQQELAPADAQLEVAAEKAAETQRAATYSTIMSSGPLSVLPGGPTSDEAAAAQDAAEQAQADLEALEEKYSGLHEREAALIQEIETLETTIEKREADVAALEQEAAVLTQQTADLKYVLNPIVVPTEAGWRISTGFGTGGGYWSSGSHTGMDFAQPAGADVYAAKNGTVVEAGWGGAYGNMVVIQHSDGTQTRYAHMSAIHVSVGQTVTAGQHIGDVGSTGNSTGPHLHFEVMDANGNFMNPAPWLGI